MSSIKMKTYWCKLHWLWLALVIVVIDLTTKYYSNHHLLYGEPVTIITGFFDLRLLYNHGAAFSFLAQYNQWSRWLFVVIAIIAIILLLIWLLRTQPHEKGLAFFLACIIGGAVGNLSDRLWHGFVIDFLSFHWYASYYYPAFNVADSAVFIGAFGLIITALWRKPRSHKNQ